jgi:23S rRNA (guanosine2251-2'-O)-methyltransferase
MIEMIYGRQPTLELLRAGRRQVSSVMLAEVKKSPETDEIIELARKAGVHVSTVERRALEKMTDGGHHQGVAIEVSGYPSISEGELVSLAESKAKEGVFLVLDHIEDPQNTGALIRSAECLGVDAVIIPSDRAVGVTPAVVRASAGATEHMKIAIVVNLVRTMNKLKDSGVWFYGMEAGGESRPLWDMEFSDGVGIVVGSEGKGIGRLVRENCDFVLEIPMSGAVSSLNASASGGMVMYEVMKQKHHG